MPSKTQWKTTPDHDNPGWPPGVPFIIGNEGCERFSFYGMKAILYVYLAALYMQTGMAETASQDAATAVTHIFVAGVYALPMVGAILADRLLGKYNTIFWLSLLYTAGHGMLAISEGQLGGTYIGLALIALGAGGIKPCVSANVGDQFGKANWFRLERVYQAFYFIINFGSFFSTLLTPWLLKKYGPGIAFGLPGILMALATLVFWLGRNRYIHIPAKGWAFVRETFSRDGLRAIGGLVSIYVFVAVFWALYDQTGSAWVLQAAQMNCDFAGIVWLESQIQAINPLLILIYIPIFSYLIYPFVGRFITLTPLRKIGAGLFLTVAAFSISALAQAKIDAAQEAFRAQVAPMVASDSIDFAKTTDKLRSQERNATAQSIEKLLAEAKPADAAWQKSVSSALSVGGIAIAKDSTEHNADWPSIAWQIIAYLVITAAEVLVSVTCLEFSYTQAPPKMKSLVMSLYLLSVSAGNVLTALVNRFTQDADGNSTLVGAQYYWFFTYLMLGAAFVYIVVSQFYKPKDYLQDAARA